MAIVNTKETAAEFFRRYSDLIVEAEQVKEASGSGSGDADPDVEKADKVKGKDGKTQAEVEKKLPPWLKGGDKASKGKAK